MAHASAKRTIRRTLEVDAHQLMVLTLYETANIFRRRLIDALLCESLDGSSFGANLRRFGSGSLPPESVGPFIRARQLAQQEGDHHA